MECIVLAGGLGTRLQSVTKDALPKCMALVNGQPFLHYLFSYLQQQQVTKVLLSLGHKASVVLDWLQDKNYGFEVTPIIEQEPLGTGGGIQLALQAAQSNDVIVMNGDTLFLCDIKELFQVHQSHPAAVTLALKIMQQYDRYGSVILDDESKILAFEEKKYKDHGTINAGTYCINKHAFLNKQLPTKFSFEKDYLEAFIHEGSFYGRAFDAYFIDIGIPEDYHKAQHNFLTLFP